MPVVTVVIPSFNCCAFLPEAIDSALGQTFTDVEVIVVDDGSTDGTKPVMQQYSSHDRVRYIWQENRGVPAARNRGVVEARGEFITALDADDLLASTAIEEWVRALEESGATWCIADIVKFWEDCREVRKTHIPEGDVRIRILREDFITRAMFFRRSALLRQGMWDVTMLAREDWDLNIRLILSAEPFVYVPRPLYCYRRRPGGITLGNPASMLCYTERLLKKHHKTLADAGDHVVAMIYADSMWGLARRYLYERRDVIRAASCIIESLMYDFDLHRLLHPLTGARDRRHL